MMFTGQQRGRCPRVPSLRNGMRESSGHEVRLIGWQFRGCGHGATGEIAGTVDGGDLPPFAALSPTTTPTNPRSGRPSRRRPNRSRRRLRRRCFPRRRRRRPRRPLLASKPISRPALEQPGPLADQSSDILDLTEFMAVSIPQPPAASAVPSPAPQFRTIDGSSDVGFDEAGERAARGGEERSRLLSNATSAAVDPPSIRLPKPC